MKLTRDTYTQLDYAYQRKRVLNSFHNDHFLKRHSRLIPYQYLILLPSYR